MDKDIYKKDKGKIKLGLIPTYAQMMVGIAATIGSEKYGDRNWEQYADKFNWTDLISSAERHIMAFKLGQRFNKEDGYMACPHLANAVWCLMVLLELSERGLGNDDRSKLLTSSDMIAQLQGQALNIGD